MPASLLRYVASLAVLLAVYGLYALAAVPFIEPEAKFKDNGASDAASSEVAESVMREQREQLSHLFHEGDWERNSPKVLASDQAKLLFRDYKPRPDGRIELTPFSLVFYVGGPAGEKEGGRPIVMRAPLAVLQFDKPLNLGQTDLGRLLGGRMEGEVTITSGETSPGAGDALEVVTRNVQLDEERIWTPNDVQFRYGPSYGSGRDLSIAFTPNGKSPGDKKQGLGASGIKSLELVHVDKLHLVTGGGLLPGVDVASLEGNPKSPARQTEPLPVEVTCRGPFRFDFNKLIASFEEQVNVRRLHPGGATDQLTCQLLELYFDKGEKSAQAATPAKSGEPAGEAALSGLEVQRLVAVGHPVVLTGAAGGASARGQRFEYDLRTRRILLEDSQKATLRHDRHYIESRGLAYELAETGRLGRLWAAGPGLFRTAVGVDGKQQFEATWEKELRLRPHQGSHVISLTRNAGFSFSNQGGMTADEIHVWLREEEPGHAAGPAKRLPTEDGPPATPAVVPEKLLALGKVQIDSAQLSGRAPRLEAWFKTESSSRLPGGNEDTSRLPGGNEDTSRLPGGYEPAGPFDARNPARRGGSPNSNMSADSQRTTQPPQKFDVSGKLIQIQMVRRGTQTEADNITVDGQVRLVQLQNAASQESPLDMRGDTLQLFHATSPSARARVTGRPAQVEARGMKLSGTNIQLHKGENRVWIDGAGEMTLPAQQMPLAMGPGASGNTIRGVPSDPRRPNLPGRGAPSSQPIVVTWQQRMNFDGQTARFEKQVEAKGETQYAKGEVLEITLNRRLDFSQPKSGEPLDVQRLAFDGGVFLENRTIEERRLTSIEQLQARKLSIDNATGRLHAVGPGWVSSVRLGSVAAPGSSPGGLASGGRSSVGNALSGVPSGNGTRSVPATLGNKPASDGLNYLHVDFQTALAGNMVKREIQFLDRVTAVYGPVTAWEEQLSPDRLEDLPENSVIMNCDRLTVTEMGQNQLAQKLYEMEAAGNTRVEGKAFTATAERMTYAQAKDLIVLEGDGRTDAELWRQTRIGGSTEHAAARKILYWQSDNRAQVDDARFLDFSQFGAPPPRAGARK